MKVSTLVSLVLVGTSVGATVLPAHAPGRRPLPPDADTTFAVGPTWRYRALTALGGAALGAGLGFFGSQLSRSDWAEHPGFSTVNRGLWAAVGGDIGLTVGLTFPLHGPARPATPRVPELGRRAVITAEELQDVVATNAYEVVRILRPEWLVARPADILGDSPSQTVPVYLDDFRLGGIGHHGGLPLLRAGKALDFPS
ncbi:MAG TPA: hypothetical protein VJ997_11465 [Longimicrobiales bacterium]|nr:hypothetical protein [Longimicrobiales bacterium]